MNRTVHLVSNGRQQSVETRRQENSTSKGVTQRQRPSVSLRLIVVDQQEAHWDQDSPEHQPEQPHQPQQLHHQQLHPGAQKTVSEPLQRTHHGLGCGTEDRLETEVSVQSFQVNTEVC